ncbi:MAG: 30S ribosomal protein S27ae [Simkania sp.]|nr:30S ribosomal protein S27ae [Nanoarchaeota archaeon]MCB1084397.1 30S ribosomal protein S27ae [Simkania sp.]
MADEKKSFHINALYEGGKAKNKSCPKCGPGIFLADHKDRVSCGKCGYTEKK